MRAIALLVVLVAAKILVLSGRAIDWSASAVPVYFAQDVLIALAVAGLDAALRRPKAGWILYVAAAAYIAINVPVTHVLGSPLTGAMLRAARGPLADSIALYVNARTVVSILVVIGAATAAPISLRAIHRRLRQSNEHPTPS